MIAITNFSHLNFWGFGWVLLLVCFGFEFPEESVFCSLQNLTFLIKM